MKYFSFLFLLLGLPLLALAQDTGFVPLTNIPAITEVGNAITTPDGLSIFLNNIYRLAIGIAAVVAVLQIMRAGIMYMGGDSVTEKKEAKNLIALSIGGLILVLSPVVVFSIINPEILSLKIGNLGELKATPPTGGSGSFDPDGDEGDGGGVDEFEFRATVFSKYVGESLTMANLMKTACNPSAISTSAQHIIKALVPKGPYAELIENGNDVKTMYTLYCESESASFFRYTLGVRNTPGTRGGDTDISTETEPRYAPTFEQYASAYENSCRAEGGNFVRDPDWFWSGYDKCNADIETSIFESLSSGNVSAETHSVNCQQVEFYCRKP